jgi:hypothetical protein
MQDASRLELHAMLDTILDSDDESSKRAIRFLLHIGSRYVKPVRPEKSDGTSPYRGASEIWRSAAAVLDSIVQSKKIPRHGLSDLERER